MGIWHYQAVVTLPTGDPFLVYTRTHNSSSNLGESTATAEIVKEWAQLIKGYRQDTTMCMDSYFLSGAGRGILRDLNVRYSSLIASLELLISCPLTFKTPEIAPGLGTMKETKLQCIIRLVTRILARRSHCRMAFL